MNKCFSVVLALVFVVGYSTLLHAQSDVSSQKQDIAAYRVDVGNKAERGFENALLGWTEVPKRVVDITRESGNPIWGLLAGGFQGTLKAMARTASGVTDIVTAPVDPEKAPLMNPDIAVE